MYFIKGEMDGEKGMTGGIVQKKKRIIKGVIFCLPLCLAVYGYFVLADFRFLDAVFHAISLYAMGDLDTPPNLCVEIARWTAPVVTASGVIWIFSNFRECFGNWICYLKGNSIAVYGCDSDVDGILEELKGLGIRGKDSFAAAGRYILLGSEEENFAFYRQYQEKLKEKKVYLKCDSMCAKNAGPNLKLFCEEEIAARAFWKKSGLSEQAKNSGYQMKIVMIGFGKLEQELLLWGLQDNLFSPAQRLEYHIFGDGSRFRSVYHELDQVSDPVLFHDGLWYEELSVLQDADRILIGQANELEALLFALPEKTIDVLAENEEMLKTLEEQDRLRCFYWKKEAHRLEYILEDALQENAKRINLRYAKLYNQVEENEQNKETEWSKLDTFTRYSNINAADYHEIRCRMLATWMKEQGRTKPDREYEEFMAELEHMRWCRYHYLKNWKYGVPENGKNKDKKKRIHKDLVPYELLSEADKEKDRENVRILLRLSPVCPDGET